MARIKCPKCEFINEDGRPACSRCGTVLPRVKIQAIAPPPTPGRQHPQMNQIQFRRDQVVAGRYTVLNMIGRGGMGCIYHVRDNALKDEVALKTLLPQFMRDKMVVERFFNEARIARGLSHPNIVRVHDIGTTGDIIYISMELIRGKSLRGMLETSMAEDRMPFKQALRIIDQLCDALEYAHLHTVHRDIKPENVMVADDGTVKLMDFGISKLMDSSRLTGTSIIMGTPMYMSPEQLRNSANVDARADIYSVGVMLYEMITGNLPTSLSKPASQITRGIPPAIDVIVAKCVEPDPEKRFQSVTDLRAALQPFLGGEKMPRRRKTRSTADAYVPDEPPDTSMAGRRAIGVILILAIAALAAAGFYTLEVGRRAKLEKHPVAVATPISNQEPAAVVAQIDRLRATLRDRLAGVAERNKLMATLLDCADAEWQKAEAAAADPVAALDLARIALQAYVGPLATPPGMVFVPPGNTFIGNAPVFLEGFYIDATEVTVGDYRRFCEAQNWPPPYDLLTVQQELPISGVTFYDAMAYAAWAKKQLPTETQWARAAIGDTNIFYPWPGGAWQDAAANTADGDDAYEFAAPIKTFASDVSWVGCYDITGNLAEWTRSMFADVPYNPDDGRENMAAITFGTQLVIRGSSFADTGKHLQTRVNYSFEGAWPALGFRCVTQLPRNIEPLIELAKKTIPES